MYPYIGAAAGGVLGFIAHNTRGAYIGSRLGHMYGKRKRTARNAAQNAKRRRIAGPGPAIKKTYKSSAPKRKVRARKSRNVFVTRSRTARKGRPRRGPRSSPSARSGSSYFSIGNGPRLFPGFKRTQQPTTFTGTVTARITCSAGQCQYAILPTYRIPAGTLAVDTQIDSFTWVDSQILNRANRWLQDYQNSAQGAAAGTANHTGQTHTTKFVCNYLKYDMMCRNATNQDLTITFYDCVLRSGAMPNLRNGGILPILDFDEGLAVLNGSAVQTGAYLKRMNAITVTPFMSPLFCKLYKVRKTTTRTMASGEVHHHIVTCKPRNLFDTTVYGQDNAMPTTATNDRGPYIQGISGFTMVQISGSIGHATATVSNVTTTPSALDVIVATSGSFSMFTRERRMNYTFDQLDTNLTAAQITVINDDTDAPGTVQVI